MSQFECNAEEVFEKFASLSKIEMTKAMKSAIKYGAQTLRKQTKANASAGILTKNNHPNDGYNGDSILDAPRVGRFNDEDGEDLYQIVHVLGTRKSDSQTYRFRFLEGGTKDRYARTYKGQSLKKPRYLGRITPRYFFRNAQSEVFPQMDRIFLEKINQVADKINNTKL